MDSQLDLFISSKMVELAAERKALHDLLPSLGQGSTRLRAWVFEDIAPASNKSIRDVDHLQEAFKTIKRLGVSIAGAYFNADSGFDTREARKVCFNHHLIPNIAENKRNRKSAKRGRKRLFNPVTYKDRFVSERTFAWSDKFRALLVRFDLKKIYFMGSHFLAFTLINMRNSLA